MRKKSHISLANLLLTNMQVSDLNYYRKTFFIGSILPDLKPSFFTRKHTIDETFHILIDEIKKITVDYDISRGICRYYARHLGVITHYLADYCTYPHNSVFTGSIKEHVYYEKELKFSLKEYVQREEAKQERDHCVTGFSLESLTEFILKTHKEYIAAVKEVKIDIKYIVYLCHQVVNSVLSFFESAIAKQERENPYELMLQN